MEPHLKLLKKHVVQINADCVKRCPHDNQLFALGHYSQIEGQNVIGAISLLAVQDGKQKKQSADWAILTITTGPILHMVWLDMKVEDQYVLVAACRDSCVRIYLYNPSTKLLVQSKEIPIEGGVYCPYLDALSIGNLITIAVSTNHQCVWYIELDNQFNVLNTHRLKNHEYTVWTCKLNPFNPKIFCSGDELNRLNVYDMRNPNPLSLSNNKQAIGQRRVHSEGICDILFEQKQENIFLTSCFGGYLRWFDIRKINSCIQTYKTNGVLWRIVPDWNKSELLLCVSSENYYEAIDIHKLSEIKKLYEVRGHQSLAYAADWNDQVVITASFYDKLLCMWERK